jgi:uncharacterized protein affecting Mg2+/Co2+ transport
MAEIYKAAQSTIMETARDTLKTALDAIVWTDISPAISYVYDNHRIADMSFNAVSLEIAGVEKEFTGQQSAPSGPIINYWLQTELRIHTAVAGRHNDYDVFMRLANSLQNFIAEKNHLGTHVNGQMVIGRQGIITPGQTFEESDTVGGTLSFAILWTGKHTQV